MTDTNNQQTLFHIVNTWGFLRHVYGDKTVDRGYSDGSLRFLRRGAPEENGP